MTDYQVSDNVRVITVPPYLYRDDSVSRETAEFFERCLGKVFRVQDFDENGQLELWTTSKGNPRRVYSGLNAHTIWIEPEFVEQYTERRTRKPAVNIRLATLCAVITCLVALARIANADQKLVSPAAAPQAVSEKDVLGDWTDRDFKYWEIRFEPDHTLSAYHGDYAGLGPYVSTWKMISNHVIVDDSPALWKQGFFDDWGSDFLVVKFKHHIMLLPTKNVHLAQKYGLASPLCLWRSTKDGLDDLVDKKIDIRKVMEQMEYNQIKQRQDSK